MTSHLALYAGPAAGFDEPFEMLAACHERARRSLDLLQRLHAHVQRHGVDTQASEAAADVLRYFDRAAPAHHEDEERHVLPRLRACGHAELADKLQAAHVEMVRLWQLLRAPLGLWADGREAILAVDLLLSYTNLYADHMQEEEGVAFAAAQTGLDAQGLSSMGMEMAGRRQS